MADGRWEDVALLGVLQGSRSSPGGCGCGRDGVTKRPLRKLFRGSGDPPLGSEIQRLGIGIGRQRRSLTLELRVRV